MSDIEGLHGEPNSTRLILYRNKYNEQGLLVNMEAIEERKTGRWERVANNGNGIDFRCSACHHFRFHNGELRRKYNYCPRCGAKMEAAE